MSSDEYESSSDKDEMDENIEENVEKEGSPPILDYPHSSKIKELQKLKGTWYSMRLTQDSRKFTKQWIMDIFSHLEYVLIGREISTKGVEHFHVMVLYTGKISDLRQYVIDQGFGGNGSYTLTVVKTWENCSLYTIKDQDSLYKGFDKEMIDNFHKIATSKFDGKNIMKEIKILDNDYILGINDFLISKKVRNGYRNVIDKDDLSLDEIYVRKLGNIKVKYGQTIVRKFLLDRLTTVKWKKSEFFKEKFISGIVMEANRDPYMGKT